MTSGVEEFFGFVGVLNDNQDENDDCKHQEEKTS